MTSQSLENACRLACLAAGIEHRHVPPDGRFHVADVPEEPNGKNAGRIKVFPDGQGGFVCNWITGVKLPFFVEGGNKPPSREELERIKQERLKREKQQAEQQAQASRRAIAIWNNAKPAPASHPYLVRKQIKPHILRVSTWRRLIKTPNQENKTLSVENSLLVPMYNERARLTSLQAIFTGKNPILNRDKDFFPGGGLAGLFTWLGAKTETVLICEGFATGATLHEDTQKRVYRLNRQ